MIRFAIKNPELFYTLRKIPLFRSFVGFNMTRYDELLPDRIKKEIFASFYVPDGTSRQTEPNRFSDLDKKTVELIRMQKIPVIHDIAVADGCTSHALLSVLKKNSVIASYYISDKYLAVLVENGNVGRVYCADGTMIAAYFAGLVAESGLKIFVLGKLLYFILKRTMCLKHDRVHELRLLSGDVIDSIENKDLYLISYDLFSPPPSIECTFIRCMNVLNKNYFSKEKIRLALENIKSMLCDDGIVLIGRTMHDHTNHATFYRKKGRELVAESHVGAGYEGDNFVRLIK